jgi:hypothetical protein
MWTLVYSSAGGGSSCRHGRQMGRSGALKLMGHARRVSGSWHTQHDRHEVCAQNTWEGKEGDDGHDDDWGQGRGRGGG